MSEKQSASSIDNHDGLDHKVSVKRTTSLSTINSTEILDEAALAGLGYKQEFRRDLSFFSTFSVSFSCLALIPSIAGTLYYSIGLAGTPGMVWGWMIAAFMIQTVVLSMAEIASSLPTSGAMYYATMVLAPPKWAPFAAYLVGWSNWLGLCSGGPGINFAMTSMMLSLANYYNPDFVVTQGATFGIAVALTIFCAFVTCLPDKFVGRVNEVGSYLQTLFFLIFIIGIPAADMNTPKFNPSSVVWGDLQNGTEFPIGIAVLMTFLSVIYTMSGYDAPFHLSEECANARVMVPRAIAMTGIVGAFGGWFMCLVVAYTVVDVAGVIDSPLGQPFVAYLFQVVSPRWSTAFVAMTVINGVGAGQACMMSGSRLAFGLARDGVFPLSSQMAKVNKWTGVPVNATIFNCVISIIMLCLIWAGPLAIGAIFSCGAIAMYFAFTVPIFVKTFAAGERWHPGPWTLGKLGKPINYMAIAFVFLMIPILLLPTVKPADLTTANFNWALAVWGGTMVLALLWFAVRARHTFKGPKINVEHIHNVDGQEVDIKTTDLAEIQRIASAAIHARHEA